jgi:hypothetical protein
VLVDHKYKVKRIQGTDLGCPWGNLQKLARICASHLKESGAKNQCSMSSTPDEGFRPHKNAIAVEVARSFLNDPKFLQNIKRIYKIVRRNSLILRLVASEREGCSMTAIPTRKAGGAHLRTTRFESGLSSFIWNVNESAEELSTTGSRLRPSCG